ncbi:arginine n-methyltransferase [Culex quinquefasciatus]|uniref:type I protein arginine methyltransferase n=1 Tax=Culex quinquefasciatus TaxID=7176 RepID=B0WU19_CULQU|nr:arginine n-methyltransferase [Culex quinquefasciatus]|eukprot:XP_001857528.1 arginine n-methyltransferase [Culex quinquefasciatus]
MDIENAINGTYFDSYEDLEPLHDIQFWADREDAEVHNEMIHRIMLTDKPRQDAYQQAILGHRDLFEGKTVLDVGAGTGILSVFCAQAGAKRVYAVEASNLARLAREVVKENGFEGVVEVVESKVEDFQLPEGEGKVDIIVSEWMGFFLLHEGMLDSVIYARDKFLKPSGLMFPDTATIYVAPCSVPGRFDEFESLSGVSLRCFGRELRKQKSDKPEILNVEGDQLLHEGHIMAWLDLKEVSTDDLNEFDMKEVLIIQEAASPGRCIWFDCSFPSGTATDRRRSPATHWKQSVILLPEDACETVDKLDPIAFSLSLARNTEHRRRYNLQLTLLDAEKEEHSLPCECVMTKCILMKAHLQSMEVDQ